MQRTNSQLKIGAVVLLTLVFSMLLLGINNITNAQDDGIHLNLSGPEVIFHANVWLKLTADGTDILGDADVESVGGMDSSGLILIYSFRNDMKVDDGGGKRELGPLIITKKIDPATPLIGKGFAEYQDMYLEFYFTKPDSELGIELHYFTITISGAKVSSIRTFTLSAQHFEEVGFIYNTILMEDLVNQITYEIRAASRGS
ncbi:MAG: type VI secretion system tube protein Hcp [Candidatus Heimdallarchaeota archaeon]|nr:type VI secretion system tube protein Hcp [Candidatus Heimdallarchaeota archaeon]